MEVIFLEDVPNVGRMGQTRVVADGYARNYLLPRRLAVPLGSREASAIQAQLKKRLKQREREEAQMAELAKRIDGLEITLPAKVGEGEKLYGSITSADIAEALGKVAGCEVDRKKVELPEPIKQAGRCEVTIKFTHEIMAKVKVNVVAEDAKLKPSEVPKAEAGEKAGEKAERPATEKAERAAETKPSKAKAAKEAKSQAETKPEPPKEKKPRAKAKKAESGGEKQVS